MTATPTSTFVIVGAGLAGAKAAETLRAEGFDGRLLLLGEEAERPPERPALSKAYLRGETDRDSLYVHQDGFAAHDIELRPSTPVRSLDPAGRQLELASGERISYDRLLVATGAAPRRAVPGAELAGVHYLRSRQDADTPGRRCPAPSTWWWGPAGSAARPPPPSAAGPGGHPGRPGHRAAGPGARPEVERVYRDLCRPRRQADPRHAGRRLPRSRPGRGGCHRRR